MSKNPTNPADIRLIVNADDYGYTRSVSQGILDAACEGAVNATGIMANGVCLDTMLPELATVENLDTGVHLNLTYGNPLTSEMKKAVSGWGGSFPGKYEMAVAVMSGKIRQDTLEKEFSAQIEQCMQHGIKLRFLNSHEHIHMLPSIYRLTASLARQFKIPFVRHTTMEWAGLPGAKAVLRNVIIGSLNLRNVQTQDPCRVTCIGIGSSGRLNHAYLSKLFSRLRPGHVYELMCHPGHFDPAEIKDGRLIGYHSWEAEQALLTGNGFRELRREYGIELARYSELV